jgi:aldehyde dehydrogenase (NAD+)
MERRGSYIDGAWLLPAAGDYTPDINPSDTSDVIAEFHRGDAALVDEAVAAARAAQPGWWRTSPQDRANILEGVAARLFARADELAELLAREEGKARADALGEVLRAAHLFRFFSGEAVRMTGERQDSTRVDTLVTIHREPVGVVGIITPWNFPIAIAAWKSAPALAFGNTVVLKPADLVPGTAVALTQILEEAGIPRGVFNLVLGSGAVVGEALVSHPGIDAVTFTGSEEVGRHVAETAAANLARVQLEMGGKNPLLVLADADLDAAVETAANGAFFQTGQRCTASSRLVVEDAVHDVFVEKLLARMARLTVGHALEEGTIIGPVVDARQLATDTEYLDLARGDAAATVHGGALLERPTTGYYLEPALITGLGNDARVNREEIFGPVAGVIRVADYDEGLAVCNDTPYGLVAGICTTSLRHAEHFQRHAETGMVMVNLPTAGVDPHVPFGGRKRSSYGPREQGAYARHFFTQTKTAYIAP